MVCRSRRSPVALPGPSAVQSPAPVKPGCNHMKVNALDARTLAARHTGRTTRILMQRRLDVDHAGVHPRHQRGSPQCLAGLLLRHLGHGKFDQHFVPAATPCHANRFKNGSLIAARQEPILTAFARPSNIDRRMSLPG